MIISLIKGILEHLTKDQAIERPEFFEETDRQLMENYACKVWK